MASGCIIFYLLGVSFLLQVSAYGNYGSFGVGRDSRPLFGGYPSHHFPQRPRPPHGWGCGGGHRPPGKPFPTHRPHPTNPTFPTTTPSITTRDPLPPTPTPSIEFTERPLLPSPEPEFEGFPNFSRDRQGSITPTRAAGSAQRPIPGNAAASAYRPANRPITLPADISGRQGSLRMVPRPGQGSKDKSWLRPAHRPMY